MNNNVDGVYETQVPLIFRALQELNSCVVKTRNKLIPRGEQALGRTYKLNELEEKELGATDSAYLPQDCFERVYLLHSNQSQRHVWGLFSESLKEANFYIVNPAHSTAQTSAQGVINMKQYLMSTLVELDLEDEYKDWNVE